MEVRPLRVPGPAEKSGARTAREPFYRVILHNDDRTPMEFVVHVLIAVFQIPELNAGLIMYTAHLNGRAFVQTLPRPEAVRRIGKARFAARLNSHPLEFSMEPE